MQFAEIIFLQKTGESKSSLSYEAIEGLKIGQSVKVPLRNRLVSGVVWDLNNIKPNFKTRPVNEISNPTPLLSKEQITLIKWMSEYYFCPLHTVLKLFIPKRVFEQKPIRENKKTSIDQIIRSKTLSLNKGQIEAIETIKKSTKNKFLIHGVTGSGKTEIYSRLAKHYIENGQQVLILVPEISLTPQIIDYFEKSLGEKVSAIHSKISEGERYKSWTDIFSNKAKLIIGSRSAIFSPFHNLGAIIVDEEHEYSYKQDQSPRYTVHKIIDKYLELDKKLKVVYGSATPSIETAETLKDSTIYLNERIGDNSMPTIEIVDLREEFKKQNHSIFSEKLKEALNKTLNNKEQAILFINRRGAASSVVCRDCGYIEKCLECELALTYHASTLNKPSLICHHCGKISNPPSICPICKGQSIRFLGIGTQKIEAEVKKEFPNAIILRADKDSTSTKHGFRDIYQKFKKHEADILIGTQMIAKGLHLPKVSLVGVILADIGLNIPDFRTAERNFQLMTQVAGRAGRSQTEGKVIIQSYSPDNHSLLCTQAYDYEKFFKYERTQRQLLKNPPFAHLAKFIIENPSLDQCKQKAEDLENQLWKIARATGQTDKLEINSYPAYLARLRGKYRYIVLIKSVISPQTLLAKLPKEYIMGPNIKIDVDPIQTT